MEPKANATQIFDRDGNGKLDRSELEYILNNVLGQKVPAQLIDQMVCLQYKAPVRYSL
jgi:Ca2+-binding EF-hand superfamily protein